MLVSSQAYNTIASVEMISPRIMIVNFQGNPQMSVISCYSPTNINDDQETEIFYTKLTYLTRHIPKHNVLIIEGDLNAPDKILMQKLRYPQVQDIHILKRHAKMHPIK